MLNIEEWRIYEMALEADLTEPAKARAFLQFGRNVGERNEDNLELIFKETAKLKELIKGQDFRKISNERANELLEIYWEVLLFEAPYIFDSYLLYLEKNRQPDQAFYAPKRDNFLRMNIIQSLQDLEDGKLKMLSISLPPGTGKALSMDSKILTPNGWVLMKDIKVGDKVFAANGNISSVLGVFPQGKKPLCRITLDDGSSCKASYDHLWTVQTRDDRRVGKQRVVTTADMLKNLYVENGKRKNYSIDYVGKIDFEEKEFALHPYVLGVLIGDGGFTSGGVKLSSPDAEIIERVSSLLPGGYSLKYITGCDYRIFGHEGNNAKAGSLVSIYLKKWGLFGKRSHEKFIPKEYLLGSYAQRLDLLRGLMDTDGFVDKRGNSFSYSTSSKQLAMDVVELVHSLSGYASVKEKESGYRKDGEYVPCKKSYNVTIQFSSDAPNVFAVSRKADRCNVKRSEIKRFVTKIEDIGEEECQCIYIDDPSHLFITDDYIATHNTTLEKFFCTWVIGKHPEEYNLFFSHSDDITKMFFKGVLDITTDSLEYTWGEIFPDVKLQATDAKAQTINFGKYKPFASLQCTSVGSKNAGKVRASRYLFCDDIIGGIEEALNKNTLEKLWRIYGTDARQRKLNEDVRELHIATRWSVSDIIGRLRMIYGEQDRARFVAIPDIDPETGLSNFDYKYKGLSVEFFHDQELAMDDVTYRCLYKNEPIERDGLLYREDEIRRYASLPLREPDAVLGICDTKSTGIDYMFLPCFYQYDDDYYLVDCVCNNSMDFELQYNQLARIILDHGMQLCEFESNQGGNRIAHEVQSRVDKEGGKCVITTKYTETNKETRIIVNAEWIKRHVLFRMKEDYSPRSDYARMMNFVLGYTVNGRNKFDDVPDGLANFVLFVGRKAPRKTVIIMESPF